MHVSVLNLSVYGHASAFSKSDLSFSSTAKRDSCGDPEERGGEARGEEEERDGQAGEIPLSSLVDV